MKIAAFVRCMDRRTAALTAATLATVTGSALSLVPVRAAHAQAANTVASFGSVDFDRAVSESKARKRDLDELNTLLNTLRRVNATLQQGSAGFLNETEFKKLAALYEKDPPTEAEKKEIAQLEQAGDSRKAEVARLQSTPQPTPDQNKRLNELNGISQQGNQNLQQLSDEFQARLRKREEELTTKTIAVIREAVGVVAKTKGLAVVFDNKVALYTANDITADVVKQVNK